MAHGSFQAGISKHKQRECPSTKRERKREGEKGEEEYVLHACPSILSFHACTFVLFASPYSSSLSLPFLSSYVTWAFRFFPTCTCPIHLPFLFLSDWPCQLATMGCGMPRFFYLLFSLGTSSFIFVPFPAFSPSFPPLKC